MILAASPVAGAITLALVYGIYSVAFGLSQIVLGIRARRATAPGEHPLTTV